MPNGQSKSLTPNNDQSAVQMPGSRGESSKKSKLKALINKMKYDQGAFLPSYIDDGSLGSNG